MSLKDTDENCVNPNATRKTTYKHCQNSRSFAAQWRTSNTNLDHRHRHRHLPKDNLYNERCTTKTLYVAHLVTNGRSHKTFATLQTRAQRQRDAELEIVGKLHKKWRTRRTWWRIGKYSKNWKIDLLIQNGCKTFICSMDMQNKFAKHQITTANPNSPAIFEALGTTKSSHGMTLKTARQEHFKTWRGAQTNK